MIWALRWHLNSSDNLYLNEQGPKLQAFRRHYAYTITAPVHSHYAGKLLRLFAFLFCLRMGSSLPPT